jgi:predicted dehydrogenase
LFDSEVTECGGVTRIEASPPEATAEDAYSAWFRMANGCTAVHDTAFAAAVPAVPRATLMGSAGSIELIGDTKLIVRRAGEESETIEFPPAPRKAPPPALSTLFSEVAQALSTRTQISPSFDDGVAVARAMDMLRAKS